MFVYFVTCILQSKDEGTPEANRYKVLTLQCCDNMHDCDVLSCFDAVMDPRTGSKFNNLKMLSKFALCVVIMNEILESRNTIVDFDAHDKRHDLQKRSLVETHKRGWVPVDNAMATRQRGSGVG